MHVDGAPLDADAGRSASSRCASTTTLQLPDRVLDPHLGPGLEHVDTSPFKLGAEVEILFASPDGGTLTVLVSGQVRRVEPEFADGH